jgi:gluconate 2-dehydrogenase gamma chain
MTADERTEGGTMSGIRRRRFLELLGVTGAGLLPRAAEAQVVAPLPPKAPAFPGPTSEEQADEKAALTGQQAYTFLNIPERYFVEAAVARLIPADALGPGALEAGVAYFIDQQLAGAYGFGATWYMHGPWGLGIPEQGYQLPLPPRDLMKLGIAAVNAYCQAVYTHDFAELGTDQQDAVLMLVDESQIATPAVPSATLKAFFELLYSLTIEGFFADPAYGGNRDKIGWKLVGFPGVRAEYSGLIGQYENKVYTVEPASIADADGV